MINLKSFLRNNLWKEVLGGKKALILSETPTGEEEFFIASHKVYVKCNHCGNITNKSAVKSKKRKLYKHK